MLYSIKGTVTKKGEGYCIISTGALGFHIIANERTLAGILEGEKSELFCELHIRDSSLELFGFQDEASLSLFKMLISVSRIGPRSALGIMEADTPARIAGAIIEGKAEFLSKTSGIGQKTAERVIMELRDKLNLDELGGSAKTADIDSDVEEVLVHLGYKRGEARKAIRKLGNEPEKLEERIKEALKRLQ